MKRIAAKQLIPGMVAAEDIYSYTDQLLIPKGTVLTDAAITILEMYDIISIRIEDIPSKTIAPEITARTQAPYYSRVKAGSEFKKFKTEYDTQIDRFKSSLQKSLREKTPLNTKALTKSAFALLDYVRPVSCVFDMLQCMREYDDSTYAHSLNVALICNVAARWLNMSDEDIYTATSCGLFHDIGKLHIPKSILGKPARLTPGEYDVIKTHSASGYQLLQEQGAERHICNAALMHHERCDGSGYPFGLKGRQLDPFAKLVAIADVYDAMTAARVYRGPLCPFSVIELFEQEGLQQFEPRYIMTFLENIVNTYILTRCRLSNGKEGDIVYINRNKLSRPMVQCGKEYINLVETPQLSISSLI